MAGVTDFGCVKKFWCSMSKVDFSSFTTLCPQKKARSFLVITIIRSFWYLYFLHMIYADSCQLNNKFNHHTWAALTLWWCSCDVVLLLLINKMPTWMGWDGSLDHIRNNTPVAPPSHSMCSCRWQTLQTPLLTGINRQLISLQTGLNFMF